MALTRRSLIAILVVCLVHDHCTAEPIILDDEPLRFENTENDALIFNSGPVEVESNSLQGCLMECLPRDLCCSCKHSYMASMKAAMINDLVKECAAPNLEVCVEDWALQAFSGPRSGASPCTDVDDVKETLRSCVDTCKDRPLSKPLDPENLSSTPDEMVELSDLEEYEPVDLTEYCVDIRTEGYLCSSYRGDSYTAGNTLCRSGTKCEFGGYSYKWCYTDFSNHWDYCCTGSCGFNQGTDYMWCDSGNKWQYCGDAGNTAINNQKCQADFPCGVHQEKGKAGYYWCYTDSNKNWDYCCQPEDSCSMKGHSYPWCDTGYKRGTNAKNCQ